jgi:hypothetical protein
MSQEYDANDFLMGVGIPGAKFPSIGSSITGAVTKEPELMQQTDFDTNEPLVWSDGRPRMQARVILATDERDPEIADDDGTRALYVKAALQKAVASAVRSAGAKRLEIGGKLTVTYTGDGQAVGKKNPPKVYSAKYEPPDPVAQAADQPPTGTPTGAPAGGAAGDIPPAGVDPGAWAALSDEQKATLRAAMGQQQAF